MLLIFLLCFGATYAAQGRKKIVIESMTKKVGSTIINQVYFLDEKQSCTIKRNVPKILERDILLHN